MHNLYDVSIPPMIRALTSMKAFLEKGRAYAEAQGWDEAELTQARLADDMHPLTAQVQRASDSAKFLAVRVGGVESVAMADEEASFADLAARIDRTIDFLKAAPRDGFDGKEETEVVLKTPRGDVPFRGADYVFNFALPNFYFHVTTAYAILRMKGVPVGKLDFLGAR
ncbi:DUF1993 domain-containing protein [Sphingomonas sp. ST-64]|uniref:DUF1993 domain-containing protein n=1 Tax=Sphingomonas plantiphila TaxID=3163295 RepID=A0ABW8YNN9_9SPHN